MIKYQIKVYYRTELMDKVTEYMREIMDDWRQKGTKLVSCRIFEFETSRPLTPEEIEKIKARKEDWMDKIVVEEVPV